ncbi:MAG TPA: type ISP restriction/modification enzyme, partial [Polyangiales bacterium]|nr:type ISP restriction/modification enzyme [Polyangiales bacterium]
PSRVIPYAYRPFDTRFVYDDPRIWTRAVSRLRARIDGEPLLLATRFARDGAFAHVFATRLLPDVIFLSNKTSVNCFAFPRAALRVEAARDALGDAPERNAFFAYLYAILHATRYRERYAPAFAEGFPRIPMPTSRASFDRLAALGERLLALHLDEPVDAPATPTVPDAIRTASARDLACFESFAGASWHARVGGYQVCHKWLLDRARAGRTLDAAERARFASLVRALDATRACIVELDAAVELIAPAWAAAPPSQSA